jgi:hypothetical protein
MQKHINKNKSYVAALKKEQRQHEAFEQVHIKLPLFDSTCAQLNAVAGLPPLSPCRSWRGSSKRRITVSTRPANSGRRR